MRTFLLFFKIKVIFFLEEIKVIFLFYRNIRFAVFDLVFKLNYFFINPYRTSRKFMQAKGSQDIYTYGETFLSSFSKLIDQCPLSSKDLFCELGAGRGRVSFWVHFFKKCPTLCIEQIPKYVNIGKRLSKNLNIKWDLKDINQADFSKATFVYLYGSSFQEEEIQNLCTQCIKLKSKAKILTISYPLTDYDSVNFRLLKKIPIKFAWGKTDAYLQERVDTKDEFMV